MSTVLVVDDDQALLKTLSAALKAQGFETMSAHTGELGVYLATHEHPDVAVVDLGLPRIDGIEVIRQIRVVASLPIIVLSARDQEDGKVEALNIGADDYVTKPFGMDELVARIRAAMRRGIRADGTTVIETSSFTVDLAARRMVRNETDVHLTATEWRVLTVLIGHEGSVVTHAQLLHEVWGADHDAPVEYARVYVSSLRKKLEVDPKNPRHLLTDTSVGYRFARD